MTRHQVFHFARHYLEMVVAMLVGMAALALFSRFVIDFTDGAVVELVEMAVWMTVPMVAWRCTATAMAGRRLPR